jgi:lysophospholipase L1-like esterase
MTTMIGGAAQAATPAPTVDYVALGDSYASGVGAGTESTDCRVTDGAYAKLYAKTKPGAVDLTLAACSGATSKDVLTRQLGDLDANTDLVTVTVGGNDLKLVDTLKLCLDPNQAAACAKAIADTETSLTALPGDVGTLLAAIARKAPRAKLVVTGYPIPFADVTDCASFPIPLQLRSFGNKTVTALNTVLAELAKQVKATFVDQGPAWTGHGQCTSDPWLVGFEGRANGTILHPTLTGQTNGYLASLVRTVGPVEDMQAWIIKRDAVVVPPSRSPSAPTTPAPGNGGTGGGDTLPLTGGNAWVLAGVGLTLILVGGASVAAVRHRRIRTVI